MTYGIKENRHRHTQRKFLDPWSPSNTFFCVQSKQTCVLSMRYFFSFLFFFSSHNCAYTQTHPVSHKGTRTPLNINCHLLGQTANIITFVMAGKWRVNICLVCYCCEMGKRLWLPWCAWQLALRYRKSLFLSLFFFMSSDHNFIYFLVKLFVICWKPAHLRYDNGSNQLLQRG